MDSDVTLKNVDVGNWHMLSINAYAAYSKSYKIFAMLESVYTLYTAWLQQKFTVIKSVTITMVTIIIQS